MKTAKIIYDTNTCEVEYNTDAEYKILRKIEEESAARTEFIRSLNQSWAEKALGKGYVKSIRTECDVPTYYTSRDPITGDYTVNTPTGMTIDRVVVTYQYDDGYECEEYYNPNTLVKFRAM